MPKTFESHGPAAVSERENPDAIEQTLAEHQPWLRTRNMSGIFVVRCSCGEGDWMSEESHRAHQAAALRILFDREEAEAGATALRAAARELEVVRLAFAHVIVLPDLIARIQGFLWGRADAGLIR